MIEHDLHLVTVVTCAYIEKNGRVLICQRKMEDGTPGGWEFPGGKVEPGESLKACLEREIAEELSITVTAEEEIIRLRHDAGDKMFVLVFFRTMITGGELRLHVHADAVWEEPKKFDEYDFLPADRQFIKMFFR